VLIVVAGEGQVESQLQVPFFSMASHQIRQTRSDQLPGLSRQHSSLPARGVIDSMWRDGHLLPPHGMLTVFVVHLGPPLSILYHNLWDLKLFLFWPLPADINRRYHIIHI
jgi:hypothetical protein